MAHSFVFGDGLVAHSSGVLLGMPTIVMCSEKYVSPGDDAKALVEKDNAVIISFKNAEGAFAVIDMVFSAVAVAARRAGVDPSEVKMPVISIAAHEQIVADLNRRNDDLLEANNRYLRRARDAEAALNLVQKDQPVKVGA